MKTVFYIVFFLSFCTSSFAQLDSLDQKIIQLLDLTGAKENFGLAIDQLINMEKQTNPDLFTDKFLKEFQKEVREMGYQELYKLIVPIYKKHFTAEEIEGLIAFHQTELGQKLIEKTPLILQESMQVGAAWGKELGEKIALKILESDEYLFLDEIEGCETVKDGKFKIVGPESEVKTTYIERKGNYQVEHLKDGGMCTFKVEWLNSCKYTLTIDKCTDNSLKESFGDIPIICNIYEISETGYKFISHNEDFGDFYFRGEMTKYQKSNSKM